MRIALIGVSHWHTPFYLDPLLTMPDVSVIGVSDPDLARARNAAAKARCPAFADYREMCARLKPGLRLRARPAIATWRTRRAS